MNKTEKDKTCPVQGCKNRPSQKAGFGMCASHYKRKRYWENPGKERKRRQEYRVNNPEKAREWNRRQCLRNATVFLGKRRRYKKKWYLENKSRISELRKKQYQENRDNIIARVKAYRKLHQEKYRELKRSYYKKHLEKNRARARKIMKIRVANKSDLYMKMIIWRKTGLPFALITPEMVREHREIMEARELIRQFRDKYGSEYETMKYAIS